MYFTQNEKEVKEQKKKDRIHIKRKQQNGRCESYLSVITLNVNRLDTPIKRQKLAKEITKCDITINIYCI